MSIFSKFVAYIKETMGELKRVNWPTKRTTAVSTAVVIAFSLSIAIFLGLLDIFFQFLLRILAL